MQEFTGVSEKLFFNPHFIGLKCKNRLFKENSGLDCSVLVNLAPGGNKLVYSRLQKTPTTNDLGRYFTQF